MTFIHLFFVNVANLPPQSALVKARKPIKPLIFSSPIAVDLAHYINYYSFPVINLDFLIFYYLQPSLSREQNNDIDIY